MKRLLGILTVTLALALVMGACSNDDSASTTTGASTTTVEGATTTAGGSDTTVPPSMDPVALRYMLFSGSDAHQDLFRDMFAEFVDGYPGVTDVELGVIPPAEYPQKVAVQLAGGNPPDAGWLALTEVPLYASSGALADISAAVRGDADYDFDDFFGTALDPWVSGDAVYGIPFSTSPFFIVYNVDMFNAAGVPLPGDLHAAGEWTWPKFREVAAQVQASLPAGQYAFQHFGQAGQPTYNDPYRSLFQLIRAYGGNFWNADLNQCLLDTPESVEALSLYHAMVFDDGSATPPGEISDFYAGQAAMVGAQISRIAPLADAAYEWGVVPMPAGPNGEIVQYFGQSAMVVFSASPNVAQAAELVKFLTTKENVLTLNQFFPPARESVLNSDEFVDSHPILNRDQMESLIRDGIRNGEAFITPSSFAQLQLSSESLWDRLWNPGANVDEIAGELCGSFAPFLTGS